MFGDQQLFNLKSRRNKRQKTVSSKTGTTAQSRRTYGRETQSSVPVMVRGEVAGFPQAVRRTSKAKPRQRMDVHLPVAGAEISFPALPQIQIGARLISGLFSVTLLVFLYFIWTSSFFAVEKIEVTGLQRLTTRDVNTTLHPDGEPIFTFNPKTLEKKLAAAFPEFSKVSVEIDLPNKVVASVQERQPILKWHQEGRTILIDAQGFSFPDRALNGKEGPTLIVEALSPPPTMALNIDQIEPQATPFMSVEMVSAIISMAAQIPANSTLIYDLKHGGLGWKDSRGWEVYLGDVKDIGMKLNLYLAIITKLKREKIKPTLINVVYPHAPFVRVEQ